MMTATDMKQIRKTSQIGRNQCANLLQLWGIHQSTHCAITALENDAKQFKLFRRPVHNSASEMKILSACTIACASNVGFVNARCSNIHVDAS